MTSIHLSVAVAMELIAALPTRTPRILIDGRSGAGKTTFAPLLADPLGAQLIHLDDIYPGWSGLSRGSEHVTTNVLSSTTPRWRRWDWAADAPAEWHALDPRRPLVIEGCGSLTRANRALADFGIWIDGGEAARKARAIARDGDVFAEHWDMWAAQEEVFIAEQRPRDLADLVLPMFTGRAGVVASSVTLK